MKRFVYFILTLYLACSCTSKSTEKPLSNHIIEGYFEGKALYENNCIACHQKTGLPEIGIYPPLKNSDFLRNNQNKIACIIRNGQSEPLTVNGKKYQIQMPAFGYLSAMEIAQICNFINNSWGNTYGSKTTERVSEELNSCK